MIGTTAAIIMGVSAAAGHAAAAKIASNAAKNAAKTQEQAGNQSIALQRQGYADATANLSPFMARGGNAFQTLGDRLGVPKAVGASQTPAAAIAQPMAVPRGGQLPASRVPLNMAAPAGRTSLAAFSPPQGGAIQLKAPTTGEVMSVPPDRVAYYLSKGAVRA